jgi:hypothetical protein
MSGWSSTMKTYEVPHLLSDLYKTTEALEPKKMSPDDKMSMLEKLENLIFNLRRMDDSDIDEEDFQRKLRSRK